MLRAHRKLAYIFIILVVIIGCTVIAGLAVSVSNFKDSTDQPSKPETDACSSGPCRNYGTCLNTADVKEGYICICQYLYYGIRCEHGKMQTFALCNSIQTFKDSSEKGNITFVKT